MQHQENTEAGLDEAPFGVFFLPPNRNDIIPLQNLYSFPLPIWMYRSGLSC